MTPTVAATITPPAATPPPRAERRRSVVIENVGWETYTRLLKLFDGRNNARFAYDNGALEVMAPISFGHEGDKDVLGDLIKVMARAVGLPVRGGGSVTIRRKKVYKGIEPDNCYWLASAPHLAGVRKLDLRVHPPPDLALEVDVTTNSLDKSRIYAALRVPEFWRLDGDDLRFYTRGPGGTYAEVPTSPTFAGIAPADVMRFVVEARAAADPSDVTKAFREWMTQRVAGGG